ncbi:hypothetical protein [Streptosporangium sp. NPDC051022]|uniref:hypothetical protein n=1 Tax=Streptosporangium sp. NPDC051022 TaxID=3155752 RepID=UPI0034282C2F
MNDTVQETRIGHVTTAFAHDFAEFHHTVSASFIPLHVTSVTPDDRRTAARLLTDQSPPLRANPSLMSRAGVTGAASSAPAASSLALASSSSGEENHD